MPNKLQEALILERKTPKQARARNTREVIFEAAARIIEQQGALTTNAIADCAGISIGTLYGHFASKQAVLVSMARHQLTRDQARVVEAVCREAAPGSSRAREAVRALIDLHRSRPAVRRAIMAAHTACGLGHERSAVVHRAAQQIMAWRSEAGRPYAHETAMFVATRAIVGAVGAAFEEASPLLDSPAFEDDLTALAEACFTSADGARRAPPARSSS